jgi:hypothetical protein
MATKRNWHCPNGCAPIKAASLFDALLSIAKREQLACPQHPGDLRNLKLEFPLGLGASDSSCTVDRAFTPRKLESWTNRDGSSVYFYPFLVILQRHGREHAAWLPYWHIVTLKNGRIKKKYGQWAPFMDEHLLYDLLEQARGHGFFVSVKRGLPSLALEPPVASEKPGEPRVDEPGPKADGKRVFEGTVGNTKYLFDAGNGEALLELVPGTSVADQAASIKRTLVSRSKASKYAVNLLFKQWREARKAADRLH